MQAAVFWAGAERSVRVQTSRSTCSFPSFNEWRTNEFSKHHNPLPRLDLPLLWFLDPYNLIAIQDAQRIKRQLQLPHRVDGGLAELVRQVITLDEADAVFARHGAFHFDGALDHAVDDGFGGGALGVVEEDDCWVGKLVLVWG